MAATTPTTATTTTTTKSRQRTFFIYWVLGLKRSTKKLKVFVMEA